MDELEIRRIADELRALAAFGLNFAQAGSNDEERWEHVLTASAHLSALVGDWLAGDLLARYRANHFDVGPVASGEAAVFHDGKLLLVRRTDDGLWALPGGITGIIVGKSGPVYFTTLGNALLRMQR